MSKYCIHAAQRDLRHRHEETGKEHLRDQRQRCQLNRLPEMDPNAREFCQILLVGPFEVMRLCGYTGCMAFGRASSGLCLVWQGFAWCVDMCSGLEVSGLPSVG